MLDRFRRRSITVLPLPSRLARVIAATATLVVGLSAAGCGSSSSTSSSTSKSTPTPTALTKPQFLAQGNAICAQGNQRLAAAQKAFGPNKPSQAQITAYVRNTFAPDIQSQITAIRALGAPSGDQAIVTTMLDVAQADMNRVKSDPALLAGNSPPFANFAKLAHPYGLTACAAKS
jgi:ABC-type glycerol-3-phosphate transport system substrate-binding protein